MEENDVLKDQWSGLRDNYHHHEHESISQHFSIINQDSKR
jgi:hypothetical protein